MALFDALVIITTQVLFYQENYLSRIVLYLLDFTMTPIQFVSRKVTVCICFYLRSHTVENRWQRLFFVNWCTIRINFKLHNNDAKPFRQYSYYFC